jgi:hypothetical protein
MASGDLEPKKIFDGRLAITDRFGKPGRVRGDPFKISTNWKGRLCPTFSRM